MAANSGLPEGASFSWGEMWTLLKWLCMEFLAVTGHVLYMWFTPRHHGLAYYSCFILPAPDNRS